MFMQKPQGGGGGQESQLQIAGERTSGNDVRLQNVTAVTAVANIVKTSLGPVGLDKVQTPTPPSPPPRTSAAAVDPRARVLSATFPGNKVHSPWTAHL
jgi:hypothetical protein